MSEGLIDNNGIYINNAIMSPGFWTRVDSADLHDAIWEQPEYREQHVIYFLIDDYRIVYVGQTNNLPNRIARHREDKRFDSVRYFEVPSWNKDQVEALAIQRLQPKYNIDHREK